MANLINLKEASKQLGLSEEQVVRLAEAKEIEGRKQGQEWQLTRVSVIAYKARQQAQANAVQGTEEFLKPGGEDDVLRPLDD